MSTRVYENGVLVESWDDSTRTYTDHRTDPPTTRPYTEQEDAAADARLTTDATLADLATRVARIEANLWPVDGPPPEDTSTVPTFADYGGVWPTGALVLDEGTVYRNVSGVPLTTAPSGFPGDPARWTHLFVVESTAPGEPDPDPVEPPEWAPGVTYTTGDRVTYAGTIYVCAQAHTSQAGWTPTAVPALWTPAAP